MRQVIHNWLQTRPQDIQPILTFDDRMKICKIECSPPVLGKEINEILKDDVLSTTRSISDISNISPNALLEENEEAHDQFSLIWEQDTSVSVRVAPTVVFDPCPKACLYLYMRLLNDIRILESPPDNLTVEDVDRLITCGKSDGGYEALKRYYPRINLPESWTVPPDSPLRPTTRELEQFFAFMENIRLLNVEAVLHFRRNAKGRPLVPENYANIRVLEGPYRGRMCQKGQLSCLHSFAL